VLSYFVQHTDGESHGSPSVLTGHGRFRAILDRIQKSSDLRPQGLNILDLQSVYRNTQQRVGGFGVE
jgi:hypothetical protein